MVESLYIVPRWFYQIDIVLGIVFALITGFVALYAFRLYQLTREREFKLFGISFSCLSLSYLMRIAVNVFLTTVVESSQGVRMFNDISFFSKSIIYFYVILFLVGYLTLAYMTFKVQNRRAYALLFLLSVLAFAFSMNKSLTFYLIALLFLIFIVYHYARLYYDGRQQKRLAMLIAMSLLFLSTLGFMFITDYNFYQGYILSNTIEFIAYLIVAYTLYRIRQYGKKKKQIGSDPRYP